MTPEQVKALRKRAGLSQEDFGAELGVSTQTICHWEKGKHRPVSLGLRKLRAFSFNLHLQDKLDDKNDSDKV